MTGERRGKGKKKGKGSVSDTAAEVAHSRYEGLESPGDEFSKPSSKWRSTGSTGQQTAESHSGRWLSCILVVSVLVAVGAVACVFYSSAIIRTLEEYGVKTDSIVSGLGLYPRSVSEDASAVRDPDVQATAREAPSSPTVDDFVTVEKDANILPGGNDDLPADATSKHHEPVYAADSEEPLTAEAAETYAADRPEGGEAVPTAASVDEADDDVVLSVGNAQDDRLPLESLLADEDHLPEATFPSGEDQVSTEGEPAPASSPSDQDQVSTDGEPAPASSPSDQDRVSTDGEPAPASSPSDQDQVSTDGDQTPVYDASADTANSEQEREEAPSSGEHRAETESTTEPADLPRPNDLPNTLDEEDAKAATAAPYALSSRRPTADRTAGGGDGSSRGVAKKPYGKRELTSASDNFIRRELDAGDDLLEQSALREAKDMFEKILQRYPASPRAHYGLARVLDAQSEKEQSNSVLESAITWYEKLLHLADVPDTLFIKVAERLADRQHFRGWSSKAVSVLRRLVAKFPDRTDFKNRLGVQLLLANKPLEAKLVFRQVLTDKPDDGFAKVHLGFILKTSENDIAGSVPLLREGIDSGAQGVIDGRFFFHLGDAYQRLGQRDEAAAVYGRGAQHGLFLSAWQRSLYNVDRLTGRPWWSSDQLPRSYQGHLKMLEEHWETIRDEGLAQIDSATGLFVPEDENLRKNGTWKQYTLYSQGRKHQSACNNAPKTCALIDSMPEAATCKRGQVKFSLMLPDTHVWPHCGPTNCRIRAHLGLVVPDGPRIRVQEEIRQWSEGKFIIFDDSFEHEVWHTGTKKRLVLIVDLWHPELTEYEKKTMAAI